VRAEILSLYDSILGYLASKFTKLSSLITAPINQNFIEKDGAKE
jgi:hypothetical protein